MAKISSMGTRSRAGGTGRSTQRRNVIIILVIIIGIVSVLISSMLGQEVPDHLTAMTLAQQRGEVQQPRDLLKAASSSVNDNDWPGVSVEKVGSRFLVKKGHNFVEVRVSCS